MNMTRTAVSAAHLYAILDRDFKALRPMACVRCNMPLPYWQSPPDEVSANWTVGTPPTCNHGCHLVIAELVTRLWSRYDLDRTPTH